MLVQRRMSQQRQKILGIALALCILATIGIFAYSFLPSSQPLGDSNQVSVLPTDRQFAVPAPIDMSVLESRQFRELRVISDRLVEPGAMGRSNPFVEP